MSTELDQVRDQGRREGKNQYPVINAHMHLINFSMVPNDYYRVFFKLFKLDEKYMEKWWFRLLALMFTIWRTIIHGKFRRLSTMLDLFTSCMNELTDEYINQMVKANIYQAAPMMIDLGPANQLTMDLGLANPSQPPEVPFNLQVDMIHEQMIRHPNRFRPFIMFDPRRKDGLELCRWAFEELGFGGMKMYPPLGYHPVPDDRANDKFARQNLRDFYSWCQTGKVPITTHCSQGGAVAAAVSYSPALQNYLCRPYNWRRVLEDYPDLYLNLAHFGGHASDIRLLDEDQRYPSDPDCDSTQPLKRGGVGESRWHKDPTSGDWYLETSAKAYRKERAERSVRWRQDIICLIKDYPHVYTDVSYHEQALDHHTRPAYFEMLIHLLQDPVIGRRILFGTDWLMTAHSWTEEEYLKPFRQTLDEPDFKRLTWDNPLEFFH